MDLVAAIASFVQARSKNVLVVRLKFSDSQILRYISTRSFTEIFLCAIFSYTVLVFRGNTSYIFVAMNIAYTPIMCSWLGIRISSVLSKYRSMISTPAK